MYFRDPKKELPKEGHIVFVKYIRYSADGSKEINYLVCTFYNLEKSGPYFYPVNASARCRCDVIGWMPISELDSIEIK